MKKFISFLTALLIGFVFNSFPSQMNAQTPSKDTATEQQAGKKYTCTMHPEVIMDKPGKCPKCGMALVEKTDSKQGRMHNMQNMQNMDDSTMMKQDCKKMKHDSTKMKKCCMNDKMSSM
jgi:hypothetical protein